MSFALLLTVSSTPVAVEDERVVIDLTVRQPCDLVNDAASATEIIVCGERERQGYYRAASSSEPVDAAIPKAEVRLAEDTSLVVESESADMGMARSQRAMVRLKFKF